MTNSDYVTKRILITVRAAPNPSRRFNETSCVAGIDLETNKPIRLFPIPARFLTSQQAFKKYSIIQARVRKSPHDTRPESHHVEFESVSVVGYIPPSPRDRWAARWEHVQHFNQSGDLDALRNRIIEEGKWNVPSLTMVTPQEISEFVIERKDQDDWTPDQIAQMNQQNMFLPNRPPGEQLEFVPYKFYYSFKCENENCRGHRCSILDWELSESYRRWRRRYADSEWEAKLRQKYEVELPAKDLRLFMGTNNQHPESWMIIGLYYPPRAS